MRIQAGNLQKKALRNNQANMRQYITKIAAGTVLTLKWSVVCTERGVCTLGKHIYTQQSIDAKKGICKTTPTCYVRYGPQLTVLLYVNRRC